MNKRVLTVPVLGALLALAGTACSGGDDTAQLDNWAKGVCAAAKDPIAQSRTALADTGKVVPGEVPADLQKRLSADLAQLAGSNQKLADAVDQAGTPKTDNGDGIKKDAVAELRQSAQGYLDAQKKLDGLATTEQAKFADGLRSVGDQVQQLSQLSTQALARIQTGALGDAVKKQPGCKQATGGTEGTGGASGAAPGSAPGSAPAGSAPAGSAPAGNASAPAATAQPSAPAGSGAPAASGKPSAPGSGAASPSPKASHS